MFFLQMSGFPGSGKSTLARAIAPQLDRPRRDEDSVARINGGSSA